MNIAFLLVQSTERYPDHTALVFENRRWTYAQWLARIGRLAKALSILGVRPQDRVAFYVSTSEASATTYFACQLLGAVAVPMNFRLAAGEVAHILQDSGARVLVYGRQLTDTAMAVAERVRTVHGWISCAEDPAQVPPGHLHFETLAEEVAEWSELRPDIRPDQLSALVYTSGTTGRPKGVMHSHANDVAIAMNCVMEYDLGHRDKALHIAPLYHVGGMQAYFIPHLMVGGTNVVLGRYDALKTLEVIQSEAITALFAVPTQIQEMLFHPRFAEFDVRSLRMITTGGAAISKAAMARGVAEFCPSIFNGYGMTEASLTLLLQPDDALAQLGSCGKPTLITTARIIRHDPDREGIFAGGAGDVRANYHHGIQRIPRALWDLDVPTIAAVNGPAIGAGCDLACMCDIRIASDTAVFAESFVKLGIIPGDGGAWLLPRVVGLSRACEMAFTGDAIDARTALSYGLVSRVVPAEELLPAARALAARIAANPPLALRWTKRLIREGMNSTLPALLQLSAAFQDMAHRTADHAEAIAAFFEKRPPDFQGR